ncbi:VWA domain-containing protein [Sphingopyxis flava]|uniref:von Willebrand factor type A domain-containing protein n=1 Tax=Sphingopyxis flava TaxID=1507287 RepID=A0A1T5C9I5_9SPHN|nr:VWA domain-containing protein [Sphingopyxis flava]SKB56049.1 von Willebrand factor type A domain-containing protein [Sphingopyxis flava]
MRSRFLTGVMMAALVAAVPAPLAPFTAKAQPAGQREGFCRTADPLPRLGPEASQRQGPAGEPGRSPSYDAVPPPPPPAPPAPTASAAPGRDVIVTGAPVAEEPAMAAPAPFDAASSGGSSEAARAIVRPWPHPRPQPQPQSGILTAGEHDDLLNPELYAAYVNRSNLGQKIRALPRVDTMRAVTVKVSDRNGQPIPFAEVTVTCSDGNSLSLATHTDGSAVFFPGLDRLSERITVSARRGGRTIAEARPVFVSDAPGGQLVGLTANQMAAGATKLDLMLVIDTTGSMGDEIAYLQAELRSIIAAITAKHRDLDIRIGFVFYRDLGDDYVTRTIAFDRGIGRAQGVLAQQYASGGGDYPEAMDQALIRAVGQNWRPDAVKSLLLVADAPPHDDRFARTWAAAEAARAKRIHITPVAASGVADEAEYAMRAMAAVTQSRYLFLTDDSGVGNPHAAPAIDCYLVTRLDALVRRVIDSQISGRRIEPEDQEVIRRVGQYDAGKCILPAGFRWDNQ